MAESSRPIPSYPDPKVKEPLCLMTSLLQGRLCSLCFLLILKANSAYRLAFSMAFLLNANTPNTVKTPKFDLQTKCLVFKIFKSFDR